MRDEATGSDSAVERGEEGGERGEVTEDEHKRRNEHGSRKTLIRSVRPEPRERTFFFHPQGQAGEQVNEIKHGALQLTGSGTEFCPYQTRPE